MADDGMGPTILDEHLQGQQFICKTLSKVRDGPVLKLGSTVNFFGLIQQFLELT